MTSKDKFFDKYMVFGEINLFGRINLFGKVLLFSIFVVLVLSSCTSSNDSDKTPIPLQGKSENISNVIPTANLTSKQIGDVSIPILYYHAVSDDIKGLTELFVSPSEFKSQMEYLKNNNYDVITFDDLKNIQAYKKPVIITFDDGYENNYLEAYPILKEHKFKAIIFLATDFINKGNYLKEEQIKKMTDYIKFESHTVSHPDLTKLSNDKIDQEFSQSRKIIENLTGQHLTSFAYPTGTYNDKVIAILKKHYEYGVITQSGLYTTNSNPYLIKRVYIPRNTTRSKFEKRLAQGGL